MKNKKAEQTHLKKTHKESLNAKRRSEPNLSRGKATLNEKPTILIVCEGENTEPSYFRQFRLSTATIKPIGEGYNTTSLVKRAIKLSKENKYDQVWCVFDADPKPSNLKQTQSFNNAIKLAEKNNFGIAYSNQAFEYWLILHFDNHQGGSMERSDYNNKINQLLKQFGFTYDGKGSKVVTEDLFAALDGIDSKTKKERKILAIERAERNYNKLDHSNPAKEESSTTVFRLVRELLKYG